MLRSPSLKPASDEAVESRSASAIVTDALREGILHGTLPGGERLRQDAIATRFGVSQMIVREAFRQLVTEGFLRAEPRRGVSVAHLTADEAQEMTELRSRRHGAPLTDTAGPVPRALTASDNLPAHPLFHPRG